MRLVRLNESDDPSYLDNAKKALRNFAKSNKDGHKWEYISHSDGSAEIKCDDYYYNGEHAFISIETRYSDETPGFLAPVIANVLSTDLIKELYNNYGYKAYRPLGMGWMEVSICSPELNSNMIQKKLREFSEVLDEITD